MEDVKCTPSMLALTDTTSEVEGGAEHEILVEDTKVAEVTLASRNLHCVSVATKPIPITATLVPPKVGPPAGDTADT